MIDGLVVISFDQAKETGFCISKGDKFLEYGAITHINKDYDIVITEIRKQVSSLLDKYRNEPVIVSLEDIYASINKKTYKELAKLQGALITLLVERELLYIIVYPTTWKNKLNIKGKSAEQKKISKKIATEIVGKLVKNDNVADAICMNKYVKENVKVTPQT